MLHFSKELTIPSCYCQPYNLSFIENGPFQCKLSQPVIAIQVICDMMWTLPQEKIPPTSGRSSPSRSSKGYHLSNSYVLASLFLAKGWIGARRVPWSSSANISISFKQILVFFQVQILVFLWSPRKDDFYEIFWTRVPNLPSTASSLPENWWGQKICSSEDDEYVVLGHFPRWKTQMQHKWICWGSSFLAGGVADQWLWLFPRWKTLS